MTAALVCCDTCGQRVPEPAVAWFMATPVCPACFHIENGHTVCGDCSPDMGDSLEWRDDIRTGEPLARCAVCGGAE